MNELALKAYLTLILGAHISVMTMQLKAYLEFKDKLEILVNALGLSVHVIAVVWVISA